MKLLSFLPFFLILSLVVVGLPSVAGSCYNWNIELAVRYLGDRYNSTVRLIYESDESGSHHIGDWLQYNTTYWLYSDNLFCWKALEPFDKNLSDLVKEGYYSYSFPRDTLYHGAVIGEDVPSVFHASESIVVYNESDYDVLYDRHGGEDVLDWRVYADSVCYRALDEYNFGSLDTSWDYLALALDMWDGWGLMDDFSINEGLYTNYKMGLLLYTVDVLGFPLDVELRDQIECQMWRCQDKTSGGMISLCNSTGFPIGSCNAETTSCTLLAYYHSVGFIDDDSGLLWYENPLTFVLVIMGVVLAIYFFKRMR